MTEPLRIQRDSCSAVVLVENVRIVADRPLRALAQHLTEHLGWEGDTPIEIEFLGTDYPRRRSSLAAAAQGTD